MINTYLGVNDFSHVKDSKAVFDLKNDNAPAFSFDDVLKSVKNENEKTEYKSETISKNIERKDERPAENMVEKVSHDEKDADYKSQDNVEKNEDIKEKHEANIAEEKHIDNDTDKKKLSNKKNIDDKLENVKISDDIKHIQKDNIKLLIKNDENINIKDAKTIFNLKLDIKKGNISEITKNISEIKKYIESLDKLGKKDKKELDGILSVLENMKNILETVLKTESEKDNKVSIVKNSSALDSIKKLLNDIDKIKENIKKISKESGDSSPKKLSKENDLQNDEAINQNIFKEIEREDSNIKVKDKSKVNGEVNTPKENQNVTDSKTEITIIKMKDDNFIDSKAYNNYANSALKSQNKADMTESMLKFQDMMSKLVEKAHFAVNNSKSEVVMSLTPDYLGKVRIKMNMDGDNLTGRIFVDNAEIKDIFTKNIDTVITSLNEVGINIEGFDVTLKQDMPNNGDTDENIFKPIKGDYNGTDSSEVIIKKYSMPERRLDLFI